MKNDLNNLDEEHKKHLKKFLNERQNISGLAMGTLIKKQMKNQEKKKGKYIDKLFKERNYKPVKETFYLGDKKFTTTKLVEKENE